jgi:hypothetical protein
LSLLASRYSRHDLLRRHVCCFTNPLTNQNFSFDGAAATPFLAAVQKECSHD